jgi:hypothetical protein
MTFGKDGPPRGRSILQVAANEPIGWIDGIVPSMRMGDLKRPATRELQLPLSRYGLARLSFDRFDCGFYTERLQDARQLTRRLKLTPGAFTLHQAPP